MELNPMKWIKPKVRKEPKPVPERVEAKDAPAPVPTKGGAFVEILMDRDFGEISPIFGAYYRTLQVLNLPSSLAVEKLKGKKLDWAIIPYQWRYNLEIHKFHAVGLDELNKYLMDVL